MDVRIVAFLGLLAACGQRDERFLTEGVEGLCLAASECAGTYPAAVCVDTLRAGLDDAACTFDKDEADACLEALEAGPDCVQLTPFDLFVLDIPPGCLRAFDCSAAGEGFDWTAAITVGLPPAPETE